MIRFFSICLALVLASHVRAEDKPKANSLTPQEITDGWNLLFDGESTVGWIALPRTTADVPLPPKVEAGSLVVAGSDKGPAFVVQSMPFGDYELTYELKRNGPSKATVGIEVMHRTENGGTGTSIGGRVVDAVQCPKPGEWYPVSVKANAGPNNTYTYVYAGAKEEPITTRPNPKVHISYTSRLAVIVEPGGEILLRNIKLRPLNTKPLFTGKSLDGWKVNTADPKRMLSKFAVTKEGELSVKNGPGDLFTEKQFDNFVLQFECKTLGKGLNSGIFFRCIPGQYQNGYEAQIQNAYKDNDRTKPVDFGTGAIYRRVAARKIVSNDNEWFTMTVVANGRHIATWVNGYQTVDWTDERKANDNPRQGYRAAIGPLSIQGHDKTTDLLFRNIRISEIAK